MIRPFCLLTIALLLTGCAGTTIGSISYPVDALTFTAPASWQHELPGSTARRAQFVLPGDAGEASLIVYYFGEGTAGTVQANVDRWAGQFEGGEPVIAERTINGLTVHTIDIVGRYVAEVTPGSDERYDEPDYAMRAAIIETGDGPYYIKAVGPAATIAAHRRSLDNFIDRVVYDKDAAPADDAAH